MWVYIPSKIVGTALERHAWRVDCEVERRWALPIAHDIPDGVVEPLDKVNVCTVDPVHETRSCGSDDRLRIDRWLAVEAAESVISPKEEGILVVGRGAELVHACCRGAIEALVDDSKVVGIDDHAAVSGASPADEVGPVGKGRIWVDDAQARRVDVLGEVGLVRE